MTRPSQRCTAFAGHDRIASGELLHVAMKAKQAYDADPARPVRVFDDADGKPVSIDNAKPVVFNTAEAAYLAGYVAAASS